MGITEVKSPVTRPGSKVLGNIPGFSPGAFSNPSARDRGDSVPRQPPRETASRHSEPEPATTKIIGPED
jgi:hypothetical protein